MNYISIDTARKNLEIVGEYNQTELYHLDQSPLQHSVTLMPAIEKLMKGRDWKDIDCIGINLGPGSFTGIRIGVTTVKVFSYLKNIKVIPFNSLEMYAYNIYSAYGDTVISAMYSGNANVYIAVFEKNQNSLSQILEPKVMNMDEFSRFLDVIDEQVLIACDFDLPTKKDNFKITKIEDSCKNGIIKIMHQNRKAVGHNELEPLYIQVPQAQKNL
jgi:tRNA threonylcarbamoyladenosine biosynthesis protein TsaB